MNNRLFRMAMMAGAEELTPTSLHFKDDGSIERFARAVAKECAEQIKLTSGAQHAYDAIVSLYPLRPKGAEDV